MSEKRFYIPDAVRSAWNRVLACVRRTHAGEEKDSPESQAPMQGEAAAEFPEETLEAAQGESSERLQEKRPEKIRVTSSKGVMYINLED